jgi:hypothetical protein
MATLYGGQYGDIVIVIRPQWPGLERFLKKNGKFLPVADLGLQPARDKVVGLVRLFLFFCVRLFGLVESHWHNMPMTLFRR